MPPGIAWSSLAAMISWATWLLARKCSRVSLAGASSFLLSQMRRATSLGKARVRIHLICFLISWLHGAGAPVWLDQSKTSVFDFYQFFVRVPDAVVGSLLRQFTFLPEQEVAALEAKQLQSPEDRPAQTALAQQVGRVSGVQKSTRAKSERGHYTVTTDHFHFFSRGSQKLIQIANQKGYLILFQGYTPCARRGRSSDSRAHHSSALQAGPENSVQPEC